MNLHKNAKTCPRSRALMVEKVLEQQQPVSEVAEGMGVSQRTVYKWLRRYRAAGATGLEDGSSRPQVLRHKLGEDWVELIVTLRRQYRMTALEISRQLKLRRSTVAAVLHRRGLSKLKLLEPKVPVLRYEHAAPGEMIHIDVKKLARFRVAGHRVTGERRKDSAGIGWEYVHVCIDDYARVAYVEVLDDERQETATAFLRRAVRWFRRFGISIRRVLTDNGPCYKSKLWRKVCSGMGIRIKKTRPYRPQTNGKAERFIQTMIREWAYGRVYTSSEERRRALPAWMVHYNQHRNHGSVGHRPPITRMPGVNNLHGIHT